MNRKPVNAYGGVLMGLALLFAETAGADEQRREAVRRDLKDQSYLLVEHADGETLYLFDRLDEDEPSLPVEATNTGAKGDVAAALAKTRSTNGATRARGLAELAGSEDYEALTVALTLLADPHPAVRDEARYLILDHPDGAVLAAELGLVDDELDDDEPVDESRDE